MINDNLKFNLFFVAENFFRKMAYIAIILYFQNFWEDPKKFRNFGFFYIIAMAVIYILSNRLK